MPKTLRLAYAKKALRLAMNNGMNLTAGMEPARRPAP